VIIYTGWRLRWAIDSFSVEEVLFREQSGLDIGFCVAGAVP